MVGVEGVEGVHDLHVWEITSGFPALSAHVLVGKEEDCHDRRRDLEKVLYREFGIEHTTLQVDHVGDHAAEAPRLKFLPRIEKRDTR
jgi:cobalt-zinc-cadmium efflux system protein